MRKIKMKFLASFAFLIAMFAFSASDSLAQKDLPPIITSVEVTYNAQTPAIPKSLSIYGFNLGTSTNATVLLGTQKMTIVSNDGNLLVATPTNLYDRPGSYLLTVVVNNKNTQFEVALGVQGPKGDKGDKGDAGAQGFKGDKGDIGNTGAQGIQGVRGEAGPKGDKGDIGLTGATGAVGSIGPKGDTGAQGPQGERGLQGIAGSKGDIGLTGPAGGLVLVDANDKEIGFLSKELKPAYDNYSQSYSYSLIDLVIREIDSKVVAFKFDNKGFIESPLGNHFTYYESSDCTGTPLYQLPFNQNGLTSSMDTSVIGSKYFLRPETTTKVYSRKYSASTTCALTRVYDSTTQQSSDGPLSLHLTDITKGLELPSVTLPFKLKLRK